MKIDYELKKEDYIKFNVDHMERTPSIKKTLFTQRYILPIMFLIVPFVMGNTKDVSFWYWIIMSATFYIVWAVFYQKYIRWNIGRNVGKLVDEEKDSEMLGHHSILLNEDVMIEKSSLNESKTEYSTIQDIVETKEYVYIYLSSVMAFIVPKRCFKDSSESKDFIDNLKEKKSKALNKEEN